MPIGQGRAPGASPALVWLPGRFWACLWVRVDLFTCSSVQPAIGVSGFGVRQMRGISLLADLWCG